MAITGTIPNLNYQKPDGSLFNRLEMEEQMRQVWPKIHWIRIMANKFYGLPQPAAFGMEEAVLRHWTLDEMIRRGQVTGDVSGVDAQTYNDDASKRQFIQGLQYLIQSGQAITPREGEGIDMTNFVPPPPPMGGPGAPPPNGTPGPQPMPFQPPPMAPQGFGPPMPAGMPQTPPQPGPAPQMQPPPMPMQPPGMMPQGAPAFAPPMPGTPGMPQMPSTPVPPMPGTPPPQMPQPQQAAPQGGGRRGKRSDQQAQSPGPQQAAPVPPMPQGPPQGFGPPPGQFSPPAGPPGAPPMMPPPGAPGGQQGFVQPPPMASQGFAMPPQQAPAPQAAPAAQAPDPAVQQKLDQILANQTQITSRLGVLEVGICVALRATYGKPGAPDLRAFLTELGLQLPQ